MSFEFTLTGVDVRLEFALGGLSSEDVRRVRTGGDETATRTLSVSFCGEFIIDGSIFAGDLNAYIVLMRLTRFKIIERVKETETI